LLLSAARSGFAARSRPRRSRDLQRPPKLRLPPAFRNSRSDASKSQPGAAPECPSTRVRCKRLRPALDRPSRATRRPVGANSEGGFRAAFFVWAEDPLALVEVPVRLFESDLAP
jgi:hypothetical protein